MIPFFKLLLFMFLEYILNFLNILFVCQICQYHIRH